MKRRKFRILTTLSALLLAGAVTMWVRSLFWQDQVGVVVADMRFWLGSSSQRLWLKGSASLSDSLAVEGSFGEGLAGAARLEQLLPAYKKGVWTRTILIPYWFIVLPASILPLGLLFGRRGRTRIKAKSIARSSRRPFHHG